MKIIKWMSLLMLTVFYTVNANAGDAADGQYKLQWYNGNEQHSSVATIRNNQLHVYERNDSSGLELWALSDAVVDCPVDVVLNLIKDSFEVVDLFQDGHKVVLFAYKIGCVGGIDPVVVKYFAYHNGIKHALRGEEHIILGNDAYGGEEPPVPGLNLKNSKILLNYMMKKWPQISLRKYPE